MKQPTIVILSACLGMMLNPAVAVETGVAIEAGLGYSDNVRLERGDKVDQTMAVLGIVADISREEGRLTGSIAGNLDYVAFLDDEFDDALYGRMDLTGRYAFVPDVFSWVLENSWGQNRAATLGTFNPGNLENVNYFSTGPDLEFRFGPRTYATVNARYGMTSYADTPRDYTSLGGGAGVFRSLSPNSDIGLNARAFRIEYDNEFFGTDYDVREVSLSYSGQFSRTTLGVEGGYTQVERLGETNGMPLLRVKLTRQVTPASRISLQAGQEFGNAGQVFRAGSLTPGGPGWSNPDDSIANGDPFQSRYLRATWSTGKERFRMDFGFGYRQEEYETLSEFDRDVKSAFARASYRMAPELTFRGGISIDQERFDNGLVEDDRFRLSAGFLWDASPKTYVSVDWRFNDGDSNSQSRRYAENQFWLRAGYRAF